MEPAEAQVLAALQERDDLAVRLDRLAGELREARSIIAKFRNARAAVKRLTTCPECKRQKAYENGYGCHKCGLGNPFRGIACLTPLAALEAKP